jgi:hypothetical protein
MCFLRVAEAFNKITQIYALSDHSDRLFQFSTEMF